jgi:guanylate kinase
MGQRASRCAKKEDEEGAMGHEKQPYVLVIVGPSGVGKGTLISALMTTDDPSPFAFSVSHTTRDPRPGEMDGCHYHFTTKEAFEAEIAAGKFIEHAYVHGNIYGTSFKAVEHVQKDNKCCVLDIDVQGARQVKASPLKAMIVFIAPPDVKTLEKRLRGRGTETEEQIRLRTANSLAEMESVKNERGLYDAVLTNDDFKECLEALRAVAATALRG